MTQALRLNIRLPLPHPSSLNHQPSSLIPHTVIPIIQTSSTCSCFPFHSEKAVITVFFCSLLGRPCTPISISFTRLYLNFFPSGPPNWSAIPSENTYPESPP